MKIKLLLLTLLVISVQILQAQTTRLQFINNCADANVSGVDIYIDGQPAFPPTFDNIAFRNSTPYIDVPAGVPVKIGIALETSFDVNDTFYSRTITLNQFDSYIFVINGIRSTSGYNPAPPFSMDIYNQAREAAPLGSTDVLFMNGATDAPEFDMRTGISLMANNVGYGQFSNYHLLQSVNDYKIRLTDTAGINIQHNFDAPFSSLGVSGFGVTVLASGFINPANNSNGPAFGLWMSLPSGGQLIELTSSAEYEKLARVQLIHNTADTAVGKVDVYVNGQKMIDTLDYHYATPYMDAYANTTLTVGFAHSGTTTPFFNMDITLDSGKTHCAVLHGIQSDTNYIPLEPLNISVYNGAKEVTSVGPLFEAILMHACTDGPITRAKGPGNTPIPAFAGLEYGDFSTGYNTFDEPDPLTVDTGATNKLLDYYGFRGTGLDFTNKAITLTYSGFITPDSNSGGPTFSIWAAEPMGGKMKELPQYVSVRDITKAAISINVWPNPAEDVLRFDIKEKYVDIVVTDITGKILIKLDDHTGNEISTSNLAPGTYLLFAQSKEHIYRAKFVKQ